MEKKKKYVPHCLHPTDTAKREAELSQLRDMQEKQRATEDYLSEIMERLRKWKTADELYNKKEWKQYEGQSTWEIWGGDNWIIGQDDETQGRVTELSGQGFLPKSIPDEREASRNRFPMLTDLGG